MYLIIGASGFLGTYCIKNVLEKTDENIIATYSEKDVPVSDSNRVKWEHLDVCNVDELKDFSSKIDSNTKIIYLAAFHHPDKVEEFPQIAWNVNIIALANAVNVFQKAKCLYYSSTDTVYGEGSKEYKFIETDKYAPVNLYGKHKSLAEQITIIAGFNVVRFPFIFGPSLVKGRPHFFDNIKKDLESGKIVEMFEDSYRSTLSFNQCAGFLVDIIEKYGSCQERIINISADHYMSKYDAAVVLANKYNLDTALIKPISVTKTNAIFKAKRAQTAVLDNTLMKQLLNLDEVKLEL